ncbi:MAG: response regulator [Pseudomonadota bacterium]|nr:response regulator [Pseudomonadota bacterium]
MAKSNLRLLIVDDDTDICEVVKTHLNWRGFDKIEIAGSAKEALAKFKSGTFDIVLTDVKMPEKTGVDLLRDIKRERGETVVIMITGDSAIKDVAACQALGALDFVFKPFGSFADLDAVMARAIEIIDRWNGIIAKVKGMDIF